VARKPSEEDTIIADADTNTVRVPASVETSPGVWDPAVIVLGSAAQMDELDFATAAQGALADTALQTAGTVHQKRSISSAVDPTVTDDTSEGYHVGQTWINTDTDTEFTLMDDTEGAAVWEQTAKTSSLSEMAFTGDINDGIIALGTVITYNDDRYVKPNTQDHVIIDCNGDINKSRTTTAGAISTTQRAHWRNNPGGERPTNAAAIDVWDGPVFGVRLTSTLSGSTLTLGPTLVGTDILCTNATKTVITLPSDATASYDINAPFEIIRDNAVVEFKAGSGATINGVSNGRFEINTQFARAHIRKTAANTWRVDPGDHLTALAAGAELTYPVAAGSHTIVGSDYVVTLLGSETTGTVSGSVTVSGSDLDVWLLQVAPGGSGAKVNASSGGGGGSGGQVIEDTSLTLSAGTGTFAFSIETPGAGQTTNSTAGNNGGSTVWNGVTAAGGRGGPVAAVGVNGYNGSGGSTNSGTSNAGGTGTGGFNGGNSFGSGTSTLRAGGGGGGSGGAGSDGTSGMGGAGGQGFESAITGTALRYGAGGGGASPSGQGADGTGSANYGSASGGRAGGGDSTAGKRGAIILRFAIADCASEPQAV
jgi:hypothetical protein